MSITHIDMRVPASVSSATRILGPTVTFHDGAYTATAAQWCIASRDCAEDVNPVTGLCREGHDQAEAKRRRDDRDNPMVLLADKRDGSVTVLQWGSL